MNLEKNAVDNDDVDINDDLIDYSGKKYEPNKYMKHSPSVLKEKEDVSPKINKL